ncbi:hypothetical protein LOZ61_004032 [Ophidiomyces ophidiicola]|uniref:Uncharacterized protein n=1 Tax=Ophidiomyces ophidiicola TaxID=1387563 RepID=A0ACB8UWR8_9EURO|nr:hypothetical protein LOZ61_004032 [Ophidiomyces ophidiicola]KAI1956740.1 hypothetical protein LOZ59_004156 [Ophidiomyces ophidiicola]KAI1974582.1 hypothetical protein LOZ56_001104 [Ophidiomyces ophidiicola]KAI2131139.1 hypothetical protein LOZ31_000550 [Ophidiomyces ophidiicola]KAI2146854.1 hypothetical protein LOZ27_002858 [Ophidiomyces ophidiicola]
MSHFCGYQLMENPLKWSSTYTVTPPNRTSKKLYGDKICLPQSALEGILNAFSPSADTLGYTASFSGNRNRYPPVTALSALDDEGRDRRRELPYPLTFRIINRKSGRIVHAGILEFSAEENEVSLSPLLLQSLGIQDSDFENREEVSFESGTDHSHTTLIVHAVEIPKGTYVRLRPLEPGYDTEDWKALLEQYLRTNFTTLTVGETFSVRGAPDEVFQFLVDKVEPEGDAICIVDTDLEVDIEPLDEEQARESDRRRKEKLNKKALAKGGELRSGKQVSEEIPVGQYVDYELRDWNRSEVLEIELNAEDTADIDVFASPFSARQRNRPRLSEHVFSDCSSEFPKIIRVQPTNVELQDVEAIYISIHARPSEGGDTNEGFTWPFSLRASTPAKNDVHGQSNGLVSSQNADEEQCSNCHQWIPKRTLILHENFCLRNNISCPKCEKVFQKRSSEWQNHWHCPHDEMHGNDSYSKSKHDSIFHTEQTCKSCLYQARNIPDLAQHRTTVCPEKLILCQFCHLILPQKGDSDPDVLDPEVLLSGLTPHEFVDGTRTTECHLCSRIIRLRDMTTHLRHHDLDRLSRPPPQICNNPNCCTPLEDPTRGGRATSNGLGLCSVCFGPLYVDVYDPEGKALRRRIERRYLSQMLTGCGNSWCRNEYCKTGRTTLGIGSVSSKDALTLARPLVSAVAISCSAQQVENTAPLYFCTDENNQTRRKLAELLAAEAGYELGWCIAAVQDGAGDMDKAKDWLKNWAPKKGEKFGDTK